MCAQQGKSARTEGHGGVLTPLRRPYFILTYRLSDLGKYSIFVVDYLRLRKMASDELLELIVGRILVDIIVTIFYACELDNVCVRHAVLEWIPTLAWPQITDL